MKNELQDQWEVDKQEFKTFFKDWGNQWKALGWNALIPLTMLIAFILFIGSIIVNGHWQD